MSRFLRSSFRKRMVPLCAAALLALPPASAWADSDDTKEIAAELKEMKESLRGLQTTIKQQNDLIQKQQSRIDDLERKVSAHPSGAVQQAVPPPAPPGTAPGPAQAGAGRGLKQYLPDIGVVADMTARLTQSKADTEGNDKISLRELELVIGHDIDPFSRFDSTITFSDTENPAVEEAYITHWGIPGEIKARLGRIRPKVGKASSVHRDQLDTEDQPLVVQRYLGAEGLFRTGLELSRFMPAFWDPLTQEVVAGVMEGGVSEGGTLFGSVRRRPSLYAHLKNFVEISDRSNLEIGTTWLNGSSDDNGSFDVNAIGLDGTLVHYVTPNNKLKWQNEAYFQFRDNNASGISDHPLGFYSLLDYRLSPRFGIGMRGDYVELVNAGPANPRRAETAASGYFTFYQSEFARWRFQAQHVEMAEGGHDNRFTVQGTVAIGTHKHQLQ